MDIYSIVIPIMNTIKDYDFLRRQRNCHTIRSFCTQTGGICISL